MKPVTHFTDNKIEGMIWEADHNALMGWWNAYEDYLVSGFRSVRAYAEASAKKSTRHEQITIQLNIGHIKWADDHGYKRSEFRTLGCLTNTKNPNQKKNRHKKKATVSSTVTKTDKEYATALGKACRKNGLDAKTTASIIRDAKAELHLR